MSCASCYILRGTLMRKKNNNIRSKQYTILAASLKIHTPISKPNPNHNPDIYVTLSCSHKSLSYRCVSVCPLPSSGSRLLQPFPEAQILRLKADQFT